MSNKRRILIVLSILIVFFLIIKLENENIFKPRFNVDYIQYVVESFGILGVFVYILINCIRPLLFIPTTVMFISGGVIYGTIKGSIYTFLGLIGGSSIAFFLARRFKSLFKKVLGNKYLNKINSMSDNHVIKGLFIMRVSPVFPFDIVSYGAGISDISYREFLIGTLLGAFPKVVLYTFLGDQIDNVFSMETLIIFAILFGLAVSPQFFRNKLQTFNK